MNSIWFITRGYPTKENSSFAFLQPVVRGFADQGIHCIVFAPQTINGKSRPGKIRPEKWTDTTEKGNVITIIQPKYISLPGIRINGVQINIRERERALLRAMNKMNDLPDVVYAHFWDCAMIAADFCIKHDIPLIPVCGESKVNIRKYYSDKWIDNKLKAVKAVICVSTKNKKECEDQNLINVNTKVLVSPNAIDTNLFFVQDKLEAKSKLGLSEKDFTIAYVGRFSERKGVNRLISAAKKVPEAKLILIGYGGDLINSDQIHIAKRVSHEEVVNYLNAADVYCLPTLAEGCCNSIVEAMACGLPVISSDLEFNDDILDDENSIRIDPSNVEDISYALNRLSKDEQLRIHLGEISLQKAHSMTLDARINVLLSFIQDVIDNNQ